MRATYFAAKLGLALGAVLATLPSGSLTIMKTNAFGIPVRRATWPMLLLVSLVGVIVVVVLSGSHSWSSQATVWALTAALGIPTAIDILLMRLRRRLARRNESDRTVHPAK
jgi:predicted ferric reductase